MLRAARAGAAAVLAAAVTLSACGEPASDESADSSQPAGVNVRFRLWDEAAASAYQESFDAFNAIHRDIHVEVEVVPAGSYTSRAVSDFASGTMADVFWVASDAATTWLELSDVLEPPTPEEWEPAVTELFTLDGELWAVPQVWESSALFVNTALLEQTGVDVTELAWDPAALDEPPAADDAPDGADDTAAAADEAATAEPAPATPAPKEEDGAPADGDEPAPGTPRTDTLREAVRTLTVDGAGRPASDPDFDAGDVAAYGFNPDLAAPPVWLTFLAQSTPPGEALTLEPDELSTAALGYLLELPAVPAPSGDLTDRERFIEGQLALFQSTSADLRHVAEESDLEWVVIPSPAGPTGSVSVLSGVGAAANAHSPHPEAAAQVLEWVASTDGQSALASYSVGIPAANGAQQLFARAWTERGLDIAALLDPATVVTLPSGSRTVEALRAARPVLTQLFDGELTPEETLPAVRRAVDDA